MHILSHGHAFWAQHDLLNEYGGDHTVRRVGIDTDADIPYDPVTTHANEIVKEARKSGDPDLLICWFPEEYPPPLGIEEANVKTCAVIGDWDIHYSELRRNIGRYDVVISDAGGADRFALAHYVVPIYASPKMTPSSAQRDCDLFFAGACNPARHLKRNTLIAHCWPLTERYTLRLGEGPTGAAYTTAMQGARCVFNYSVRSELNMRFFESVAAGAVPLIEANNQEAAIHLNDYDAAYRYDPDNAGESIGAILADESAQRRIAEAAQALVHERLSLTQRFDAIVSFAIDQASSGRPFNTIDSDVRAAEEILNCRAKNDARWQQREDDAIANANLDDPAASMLAGNRALHRAQTASPEAIGDARECYARACAAKWGDAYAHLNAATADICAWALHPMRPEELIDRAERHFKCVEESNSVALADTLLPDHWDGFYCRLQRALADGLETEAMARAEAHHQRARIQIQRADYVAARAELRAAMARDPDRNFNETRFNINFAEQRFHVIADLLKEDPGPFVMRDEYWVLAGRIATSTFDDDLAALQKIRERAMHKAEP